MSSSSSSDSTTNPSAAAGLPTATPDTSSPNTNPTTTSSEPDSPNHHPIATVDISVSVPSLKTGLKLKNHSSILETGYTDSSASTPTLYIYGGENQLTKEPPRQVVVLELNSGYLKVVNVTHQGRIPVKGGIMFSMPADGVEADSTTTTSDSPKSLTSTKQNNLSIDTTTTTANSPHAKKLVVFGGLDEEQLPVESFHQLNLSNTNVKWESNVVMQGTWEVPSERFGATCVTIQNAHYVFGGQDHKGKVLSGVWKFDTKEKIFSYIHPRVDAQEEGASLPPSSFFHASCAWGNEMLIHGGYHDRTRTHHPIYRFNTETKRWLAPIELPAQYSKGACYHQMATIGDYLVMLGGTEYASRDLFEDGTEADPLSSNEALLMCHLPTRHFYTEFHLDGKIGARVGHTLHTHKDQLWVVGGDVDNVADQDIVVLQSEMLSKQKQIPETNLKLETVTISNTEKREAFPPPKSAFDSVIISYKDCITLNKWYGDRRQQWKLLYRATRDGFNSSHWHSKVDNQGPTISIVFANGFIFGGYTPIAWKSSGADQYDDASWLFSLKNPQDDKQYKFPKIPQSVKRQRSVYHASGYGLWMGSNDLLIYSNADANTSSNANLGKAYEYNLTYDTATFFCGKNGFKVTELETFALA